MGNEIYFKGLIEYLNWYLGIPRNSALDISSNVDLDNLNSIFDIDLKYYLPEETIQKLKTKSLTFPLKPTCFLLGISFSPRLVELILRHFGPTNSIINMIERNPYELLDVEGVPFKRIDKIALDVLNVDEDSDFRHIAFVQYHLEQLCQKNGHNFIDLEKFMSSRFEVKVTKSNIKKYLKELIKNQKIFLQGKKLYTSQLYLAEKESASMVADLITNKYSNDLFKDIDIDEFIRGYEKLQSENIENGKWKNLEWGNNKFKLSDKQKEAIHLFLSEKILLITGLPGTGKTSLTKAIVDISKNRGLRVALLAPTGIAAKRLSEATNTESFTLHKKLCFDGSVWKKHAKNLPHLCDEDIIIVDEFSMVDQVLFHKLLMNLPNREFKLVLVGDSAQLPSVSPGNVLKDLVNTGKIAHVHLDQIFRQQDTSDIIINSHIINKGKTNLVGNKKDFIMLESSDEDKSVDIILKIIDKLSDQDFQVLSPTYKGFLGVTNLNNCIQELVNPLLEESFFKTDAYEFKTNDRVMILKNDYQNEVYNGEQGIIKKINPSKKFIQVDVKGKLIEYNFKDAYTSITLDYVRSVHKSQGTEYDYVILPWVKDFTIQLQRNLLYTAVTRARKKVFIVGEREALNQAIKNNNTSRRNSIFSSRILTELSKIKQEIL